MQRLFGVPVGTLATDLLLAVAIGFAVLVAFAVRGRILIRLGFRNAWRRRSRSSLIIGGLMLATAIITSALVTGDVISHSIRSSVLTAYGNTDELVSVKGAQSSEALLIGADAPVGYFNENTAQRLATRARGLAHVDGATPVIIEQISVQDVTSRQNEPRVTLFSPSDMGALGRLTAGDKIVTLGALVPGEVYLNAHAAKELGAVAGDRVRVLAGGRVSVAKVSAIVQFRGAGSDGSALVAPLLAAQSMLGKPGLVNRIAVSNDGGLMGGLRYSSEVTKQLDSIVGAEGLEAKAVKSDGVKTADKAGNAFMSMFTTFGMFSISAGLLLIFLIFVMLAAERRGEMGIARAIGMQRRHLIQAFVYEGVAYDVLAAVVGVAVGVGIAFAMVTVMAGALDTGDSTTTIERTTQGSSLVVAVSIGILLTLVVVAASAWRVSRLNIVTAIRNLTDPPRRPRRSSWVAGFVGAGLGVLMALSGRSSGAATMFMLGVSVTAISLASLIRAAGGPVRLTYTATGLALVAWWSLPFGVVRAMVPNLSMDFSMWVMAGLMVVLGMSWVIVYNADILLSGVMSIFGRIRAAAPVLRTSIAYPLRSRFRTGITLAMFTLVVFTLVVGSTTTQAFTFDDVKAYGGGFDVRASTSPFSPIADVRSAVAHVRGLKPGDIRLVSEQSMVPADVTQVGSGRKPESYVVRGLDDVFLENTTYGLATMASGYHSARQVWTAIQHHPRLAVVDPAIVPRRDNWGFGSLVSLRLSGFKIEDKSFSPVKLSVTDAQTGIAQTYTVIGVLKDSTYNSMMGVSTSQRSLSEFGTRATPTNYLFGLRPGVDAQLAAQRLESAFLANGMQADSLSKLLSDLVASSRTVQRIVLGFMGLGLIVGIAALGVISARSVVERRQHIGVLRAIGYQRRMVQASFLLEASFISLVAIVVGTALGLICAWNVIADAAAQPTFSGVKFGVPWLELAIVFVTVYVASLLTTYGPSRKAAGTYPAEALRYQ